MKNISVQTHVSLFERKQHNVLEYDKEAGLAFIHWCLVAAGKFLCQQAIIDQPSQRYGASEIQTTLVSLPHHSPMALPILGTTLLIHLQEDYGSVAVYRFNADQVFLCDKPYT